MDMSEVPVSTASVTRGSHYIYIQSYVEMCAYDTQVKEAPVPAQTSIFTSMLSSVYRLQICYMYTKLFLVAPPASTCVTPTCLGKYCPIRTKHQTAQGSARSYSLHMPVGFPMAGMVPE